MASSSPTRKSGRQRKPNQKYVGDDLEVLKQILSSDSEDEHTLQQQLLQDDSDEFPADHGADDHDDDDGDEDEDDASSAKEASDGSDIETPVEEIEDAHSSATSDPGSPGPGPSGFIKAVAHRTQNRNLIAPRNNKFHSRGMPENPLRHDLSKSTLKLFSGEGIDDIIHIVRARDRWAVDPILPLRSKLSYGMSHTEHKRHMEATVGWDWYYDHGGLEIFAGKQNMRMMTLDEARLYRPSIAKERDLLFGPQGRQVKHRLASFQALNLDHEWKFGKQNEMHAIRHKHGWILNADGHISCMDWAPNHDNNKQYLALATANPQSSDAQVSPAFQAKGEPSMIQIWAFNLSNDKENRNDPFLHTILCNDWGKIRQLKWCPIPRTDRSPTTSTRLNIGLLAIICGDGSARVIDVHLGENQGSETVAQAQKYTDSGFTARAPPGNVSTCLTWLSSTDLAIGYADGHLAIYDICPEAKSEQSKKVNHVPSSEEFSVKDGVYHVPWLSMQLHSTYILALTSGYPSRPSLLVSSSLSGYVRLTSLVAPKTDYVLSARTRSPPSSLTYYDALFATIEPEESSETIKLLGLRCLYISFSCMRLPASPGPGHGTVDVGKCHPSLACGCADGSVMITNPLRKILGKKIAGFQQCIFKQEWRPTPTRRAREETAGCRPGISRFTEGYKCERMNMNVRNSIRKTKEVAPISTIYEEESAVTALTWNPNLSYGGWLAAGWASGLVRVQDVAIG
ncbi:hypothetical protein ACLMJK_003185 [Lecanora helva]